MFVESLLASVLLLLFLALLLYFKWEYSSYVRTIDLIPGPKKVPILGNALLLIRRDSDEILQQLQNKFTKMYGPIYRVWFGFKSCFVDISSPELVEKILTSQTFINKGNAYDVLTSWLGQGLLIASDEKWKKNRRLLTPAFHFQILDQFFDVFNKNADIFCQQLIKHSNSKEIDVYPLLKRCTLDIICETAMGIQVNAQLEDSTYITAVQRISEVVVERFFSLYHVLPDWVYFNLTGRGREHSKLLRLVHNFTEKVIRDRKRELFEESESDIDKTEDDTAMGLKRRRAFLDLLLIAAKSAELSDTNIRNEVDTFMFEGHDTTASAMVWFLYCMATNPEQQELVQKELDKVFGNSDRPCTMEDATRLKHLEMCIKESQRLYPPVPNIKRFIHEDFELGGYKIPAGTTVSLHIYALHRKEESFPDPLAYKPERFLPEPSAERHNFAFVPFSAGPRNCIGQRFAFLEEKVVLSSILRRFRFSYDMARKGPAIAAADLVIKPKNGMPLIVSKRDPAL